jgi:hypothetical protein
MISLQSTKTNELITALHDLPPDWQLTPLGKKDRTGKPDPKAPYLKKWSTTDIARQDIARDIRSGRAVGYGLKLGGDLVAIDFDGRSAIDYWVDRFGDIPYTITWTSGKDGRFQALFTVPLAYQNEVKAKKISTDTAELLEFRYTNHQSVLPPSPHPETDGYVWLNSPGDTSIAQLPQAVIDFWLELISPKPSPPTPSYLPPIPKPQCPIPDTPYPTNIPLENCLAKSNRALLNGVSQGSRNEAGATLARDLIGTENHLRNLGKSFTGSAIELFDLFVSRCSPPISAGESITIWKSAERDNPTPSCRADGVANILTAWERKYLAPTTTTMMKTELNGHSNLSRIYPPELENTPVDPAKKPNGIQQDKPQFDRYLTAPDDGLRMVTVNGVGEREETLIGNHLAAIAWVDNPEGNGAAIQLEFKTVRGAIRTWTMPRGELAGDGSLIASSLLSRGYGYNPKQRKELTSYLFSLGEKIDRTYTITDTSGWVNDSFVLPHQTIGDETLRFRDVEPNPDAITETKGTLSGWRDGVAAKCSGNSRLILALGVSFTAPLLPILDIESGGFHLVGVSSTGKTTSLKVAASVTGVKEIPHWRTTTNGLESIATTFNHLCLPLDEILQAEAKDVGNIAYMLANGQGKARMNKNLTNRKSKAWQLIFLSSGEVGLGSYMEQAKIAIKGGQEVRLPDIPASPKGANYGCFETIHQYSDPVQFIEALESAANAHHGTAIEAYLSQLVVDRADPKFAKDLFKKVSLIASKLSEGTKSNQVGRVAKRFALVQVALGLAHQYGLLPFPIEQIDWAISTIFSDWLDSRGGDGSIEIKRAIDSISLLLTKSEMTDRCVVLLKDGKAWKRPDHKRVNDFLAYRVVDGAGGIGDRTLQFWVPQNIFDDEFCGGADKSELVKVLQQMGWLELNSDDRPHQKTINGERERFYIFRIWKKALVQMVQLVHLLVQTY